MTTQTSEPNRLGPFAFLLAGAVLALVRALVWAAMETGISAATWVDAGQFVLVAALLAGLSALKARFHPAFWVSVALNVAASVALGLWALGDDVANFSERQELVSRAVAYYGLIVGFSLVPPVALIVGAALDRGRLRFLALAAAIVACVLNDVVLPNDYYGIHLFIGLTALVFAGASFCSFVRALSAKRGRWISVALVVASSLCSLWPLSPAAQTSLAGVTGAAFAPFFARALAPFRKSEAEASFQESISRKPEAEKEWYSPRASAPAVPPTEPSPLPKDAIVILITVDALRSDLVLNKERDSDLPTLARLRDEGVSFTQARTPGALTKLSMSSLFLGNYFSQQYWAPMEGRKAGAVSVHHDEAVRFPQLLQKKGVHTLNFRAISWLRNKLILDGFDVDEEPHDKKKKSYYTSCVPIFQAILGHLDKVKAQQKPAFFFSHLADPHAPYDLGKVRKGPQFERYVSEVALVDRQLGRLVKELETPELRSRVLLMVSADHGEAFGEHKSKTHGTTLYDEAIHVPMIFWRPGGSPRTVDEHVSLIDLGPTVLDAFGVSTPGAYMGQSLLPFLTEKAPVLTRPIASETRLMRAWVTPDKMKLIVDLRSGRTELYDLKVDPKESKNLAGQAARLDPIRAQMDAFFKVHLIQKKGYKLPYIR